jgi:catechol 2,3-dioxygenase-like lactoylglutathione lyase family enzyme
MFDHLSVRVPDLAVAVDQVKPALDAAGIKQTRDGASFALWGNFMIMQTAQDHPITRRIHVAFIAASQNQVDRFWQAGVDAGLVDDGPAGPRPDYAEDYYAAFLKDPAGNSFEAVHRDGERPRGNIDHIAIRVSDAERSAAFYSTIGEAAGLAIRRQSTERASFSVGGSDGSFIVIAGEPTEHMHLAFSGDDDAVGRFHADAIAAGYTSNGEPGERPHYHDRYYAAFVLDPDGNNIELVNHHH